MVGDISTIFEYGRRCEYLSENFLLEAPADDLETSFQVLFEGVGGRSNEFY